MHVLHRVTPLTSPALGLGARRWSSLLTPALKERVKKPSLWSKVCTPESLVPLFKDNMSLGWSGFTPVGYPKVTPVVLADYVEANGLQGKLRFNLFIGASVGAETEDRWASLNMVKRRWPYQTGKNISKGINQGRIEMGDIHLSIFAQDLAFGWFTKEKDTPNLDIGLIECTEIRPDGGIVLAGSVGAAEEVIHHSEKLIMEVNTSMPSFYGVHDIIRDDMPPARRPYLISRVDDRIGKPTVSCDPDRIVGIVESTNPDKGRKLADPDEASSTIASHLIEFLQHEVKHGRLPPGLLPLQSGVGNIANAVTAGLANGPFSNCTVWTEVLQDTMLDFLDTGKLTFASSTSLSLSNDGFERFYKNWDFYAQRVCLRPQQVTNHPEIIRRLGVIAMNTPVEVDMYGHANSTLIGGTKMINGIGGSGDFLRSGYLSIVHTPSSRPSPNGDENGISCVVPKVSHTDHTEHDIDIIVTEQGLADLRGLSPRLRAKHVIEKCAHPDFKPILTEYYERSLNACLKKGAAHEPQILGDVFKMHTHLEKNGTMKLDSWE